MKKSFIVFVAVALLFAGSVGVSKAQTSMSDSTLLAQLFDIVTDLAKAVSSLIERQIDSFIGTSGSTPITSDDPMGSKTTILPSSSQDTGSKISPEPGTVTFSVTLPVAGDVWRAGETHEIKWENMTPSAGAANTPNFVSIYLVSANQTGARPAVMWTVAAYTRNTGSYKWTVSKNVYSGDYLVAVEPYARPDRRTYSQSISVISENSIPLPSGWVKVSNSLSQPSTLEWISKAPLTDELNKRFCCGKYIQGYGWWGCYSSGNSCSHCGCDTLDASVIAPDPVQGDAPKKNCTADEIKACKFMLCDGCSKTGDWPLCYSCRTPQSSPLGGSQQGFTVAITNPSDSTGSVWVKGALYTIKWESTDVTNAPLQEKELVSIQLFSARDDARVATISSRAYNDGDFRWTVSRSIPAGTYYFVISPVANSGQRTVSGTFFVTESKNQPPTGWQMSSEYPQQSDQMLKCCGKWIPGYGYWWCGTVNNSCAHCGCKGLATD